MTYFLPVAALCSSGFAHGVTYLKGEPRGLSFRPGKGQRGKGQAISGQKVSMKCDIHDSVIQGMSQPGRHRALILGKKTTLPSPRHLCLSLIRVPGHWLSPVTTWERSAAPPAPDTLLTAPGPARTTHEHTKGRVARLAHMVRGCRRDDSDVGGRVSIQPTVPP